MPHAPHKLFHVLVTVGASLVGVTALPACGSSGVDASAASDAAADAPSSDAPYAHISPAPECDANDPSCNYPKISPGCGSPPCYPTISTDAAAPVDAGHDATSDAPSEGG